MLTAFSRVVLLKLRGRERERKSERAQDSKVSRPDGLAPLSDRNTALAFFGGSFPNKAVFLVVTKVERKEGRREAEGWLEKNSPCLRDMHVKRHYFINALALLAHQICQERGWDKLPAHASTEFEQKLEEVKLCVEAVSPSVDVTEDIVTYESGRQRIVNELDTIHNRAWISNRMFKDELAEHVCSTWPDLFCGKIRSFVLDALVDPISRLQKTVQEAELEQQAAHDAKQRTRDFLLQTPWSFQIKEWLLGVSEKVLDRINLFCHQVDQGPESWFDPRELAQFWYAIEQMTNAEVVASCKKCNHHASSRSSAKGMLIFDTMADATPFLTSFVQWVCRLTHAELDNVDELLQGVFEQLKAHSLHAHHAREARARLDAHETPLMHVPQGALQSVAPSDRVIPVASAAVAVGTAATFGVAGMLAMTFIGATASGGTAVYRADKFGERFVKDALYGWSKQVSGNDFVIIRGEFLRGPAEEQVNKEINKAQNEILSTLERAKQALNDEAEARLTAAEAALQQATDMLKSSKKTQHSLCLIPV